MPKNILLIFLGFIMGAIAGVAGIYNLYTKSILPNSIADLGIAKDFKPVEVSQNTENMKKVDSYIPKTLASQKYNSLFEKIINTANKIAKSNNDDIYPAMLLLREKGSRAEWEGIFDIIIEARDTIKKNQQDVSAMKDLLIAFQDENSISVNNADFKNKSSAFAESGLKLTNSYKSYFEVLLQFLTGKTPTKELADNLNIQIKDLSDKNWDFQDKINIVYTVIDQENMKVKQQIEQGQ